MYVSKYHAYHKYKDFHLSIFKSCLWDWGECSMVRVPLDQHRSWTDLVTTYNPNTHKAEEGNPKASWLE